ncbi:helix-turn-helix domain-containing protein [Chloroflexota bacterium]
MDRSTAIRPASSVKATDITSGAGVVGRYRNSRRKGGNMDHLGRIIKQQRTAMGLTLRDLTTTSGISSSHLGRIERGERLPSAHILRRIAQPLGFDESELFTLAGFLSPIPTNGAKEKPTDTILGLDPYVAHVLAQEPVNIQRSVIAILTILKSITKGVGRENLQQ